MTAIFADSEMAPTTSGAAVGDGNLLRNSFDFLQFQNSLAPHFLHDLGALVVGKFCVGFDQSCVDSLTLLVKQIAEHGMPGLKYLVFDFAHLDKESAKERGEGFDELVSTNTELILKAPVISIGWARSNMSGADLEFALSCSMIIALRGAHFRFDGDTVVSLQLYNALAHRIGFAKTERLLENQEALSADDMQALFLVREVVEGDEDLSGIERYVRRIGRRYNASYGIFRAQRLSLRPLDIHSNRA